MRRTGKRAFEPTMGSEGMSQLPMTYSIFMMRSSQKRRVFSHNRACWRSTRQRLLGLPGQKKRAPEGARPSHIQCRLHVVRGLAVRVDVETLAFLIFGHAQSYEQVGDLEGDEC